MKKIKWYFDFISPYAYLQSARLNELSNLAKIECIPLLFSGLLDYWGQKGPAEIVPKKRFTFRQCLWRARKMGIPYKTPHKHPFNPLRALRLAIAMGADLSAVQRIFCSIWVDGNLPDEESGWLSIQKALNIEDGDKQVENAKVKKALISNGELARQEGVFGVPSCCVDGHMFWGDDALEMVISYLKKSDLFESEEMQRIDSLRGISRRN